MTWTTSPEDDYLVCISNRTKPSFCPITFFKILSTASGRPGLNRALGPVHGQTSIGEAF